MGRYVKADIVSIANYSKEIQKSTNTINETISKIKMITHEMDNFFNTPTGKTVKETMLQFLDKIKEENDELSMYSERINNSSILYDNTIKAINDSLERS